ARFCLVSTSFSTALPLILSWIFCDAISASVSRLAPGIGQCASRQDTRQRSPVRFTGVDIGDRIYLRGDLRPYLCKQIRRCLLANEHLFNTRLAPWFISDSRQRDPGIGDPVLFTRQQHRYADNGEIAASSSELHKRPTGTRRSFRD